jgi:hypothetical protein
MKLALLITSALLAISPALAQDADPHVGHTMPAAAKPAAGPMDHTAMPGMDHSKMDMTGAPTSGDGAMAGMDHSKMNHGGMAMTPALKGISRRNVGPAEAALQGFSDALEVGNRDLAIARLAPQLVVAENGSEDDYAGYVGGHLASDIAFAKTVNTSLLSRDVQPDDNGRVVITSSSRVLSNRGDRKVDLDIAETATLTKIGDDWKISRIAWQSSPHPKEGLQ